MYAVNAENPLPETGEWVMSPNPNEFVVVLNNFTDLLPGVERVAFVLELGEQKEPDADGLYETETNVIGLWEVDGKAPKRQLEPTTEARAFLDKSTDRISDALNKWQADLTQEQKEEFWAIGGKARTTPGIIEALKRLILG